MLLLNRVAGNIKTINVRSWSGRRSSSRGWRSTVRSLPGVVFMQSSRIMHALCGSHFTVDYWKPSLTTNSFVGLCMHCAAHISPWTIESQASQRILLWDISLWTTKSLITNSFVGYSTVDYWKPENEFFCGIFHRGLLKASKRILLWDGGSIYIKKDVDNKILQKHIRIKRIKILKNIY
jgi:hypothetical protein